MVGRAIAGRWLRISNAYLVSVEDGLLLVDAGIPGNAKRTLAFIERLGRRPDELRTIVLTHWHIDHVGSVAELERLTGAQTEGRLRLGGEGVDAATAAP